MSKSYIRTSLVARHISRRYGSILRLYMNIFLFLVMFVANRSAAFRITVLKFHHMQRVKFSALIYHISRATFLELEEVIFGAHFRTVKLNVEIIYTNVNNGTSYYETISSQLRCQCTWSESCFVSTF